jgi:hypothetical protein
MDDLKREIMIMKQMKHNNIVMLSEVKGSTIGVNRTCTRPARLHISPVCAAAAAIGQVFT